MKNFLCLSLLSIATLACVPVKQQQKALLADSLLLVEANAVLIDVEKRVVSATKSIPPHISYKTIAWIYRIDCKIAVNSVLPWDKPFGLHLLSDDDTENTVFINNENNPLQPGSQTVFSTQLRVTEKVGLAATLFTGVSPTAQDFENPNHHLVINIL